MAWPDSLRTSISAEEQARMLDDSGVWMVKVEVRRRTEETWTNLSDVAGGDWTLAVEAEISTPDTPVSRFTVRLIRAADGYSMAPGVSGSALNLDAASLFSPLVYPRRYIRAFAYCAAVGETREDAIWHPWITGEIERVAWDDDVVASCVGPDARIQRRQIKAKEERGADDPGTPLQVEVQGLLDRWMGAAEVELNTVGDPEVNLGKYETEAGSLGDFLLSQARRVGWDLRYRWDDEEEDTLYTLYLPPRDKAIPDLVVPASRVRQVPGMEVDADPVRNDFTHTRRDATTKRIATLNLTNHASVAEFDSVWMGITEDEESPVNTEAKAMALLQFASSDLGQPSVDARHEIPFLPFLDLHHMVRFEADGELFDYDIDVSVVGGTHRISADDASTLINSRVGSPVGMYYAWRRRNRGGAAQHDWLITLVEAVGALETDTTKTYRITGGDDVYEIWGAYALAEGEPTEEAWADVAAVAEAGNILSIGPTATITVSMPTSSQVGMLYAVPKILDAGAVVTPPEPNAAKYVSVYGPPPSLPVVEVDSAKNGEVATAWVKFTERGIAVEDVQVQTRVGTALVSALSAPDRGPGDASVVRVGSTLGAGEYEEDVALGGARQLSEVDFYASLAGIATPLSVPPFYFDRSRAPRFVRVVVDGARIDVAADAVDTLSLRAFTSDVADSDPEYWEEHVDGSFYLFDVPVGSTDTRSITLQALAEPSSEVTVDTPKEERFVTVSGSTAPAEPQWDVYSVDIPLVGEDTITIGARANSTIPGYTAAYFIRYNGGAFTDITGDLVPTAGAVPTTLDTYTYATGWTRGTPPGITIEVSVRFDILDGIGAPKATQTTTRSYTIG